MFIINEEINIIVSKELYSVVYMDNNVVNISKSVINILEESCKYYGSNLLGRVAGTKHILGISYKAPIIISEKKNIIMFPTTSLRNKKCMWINASKILKYYSDTKDSVVIIFNNGKKLNVNISFRVLDKQILRASRLENLFLSRK